MAAAEAAQQLHYVLWLPTHNDQSTPCPLWIIKKTYGQLQTLPGHVVKPRRNPHNPEDAKTAERNPLNPLRRPDELGPLDQPHECFPQPPPRPLQILVSSQNKVSQPHSQRQPHDTDPNRGGSCKNDTKRNSRVRRAAKGSET